MAFGVLFMDMDILDLFYNFMLYYGVRLRACWVGYCLFREVNVIDYCSIALFSIDTSTLLEDVQHGIHDSTYYYSCINMQNIRKKAIIK